MRFGLKKFESQDSSYIFITFACRQANIKNAKDNCMRKSNAGNMILPFKGWPE